MSLFGSFGSKLRGLSSPKPFNQSSGRGPFKKLLTKDIKVTLGSRITGEGHFLDTGSVFAKEDHRQYIVDSTIWFDHTTEQKETRREHLDRRDGDGDVENQPTRPQRIKTHSTRPQIQKQLWVVMVANE